MFSLNLDLQSNVRVQVHSIIGVSKSSKCNVNVSHTLKIFTDLEL